MGVPALMNKCGIESRLKKKIHDSERKCGETEEAEIFGKEEVCEHDRAHKLHRFYRKTPND